LIDDIINLRNKIHKDNFRFVLTPAHWKTVYVPENVEGGNLVTVESNGRLKGYAAFILVNFDEVRAYDVREISAEDENTLVQLIDQIADRGCKDEVDFIFVKRCDEPFNEVFSKKGFSSFIESVIMIALFDPEKLLSALSEKVENGKALRLIIKGFDPINVKVGEKGIMLVKEAKPDLTVSIDSKTFLKLFFGRASFMSEFLRRRIALDGILSLGAARSFFRIIKEPKWYIPMGDWV
jgi:putative sterol carrier protein